MADDVNPYQSPQTPVSPAAGNPDRLTQTMLRYLKEASPWLRFMGIVGFVICGSLTLGGLVSLISAPVMSSFWDDVETLSEYTDVLGTAFGAAMGLYFIGIAALYFFPSLFQYRFGSRIRSYLQSGAEQELETAFKNNKSLWKFNGIVLIVSLAIIPVIAIGSIIVAVAMALG
ncbi:MAG: hypothetical protein LBK27_01180 [Treponema sp.]|jgi:hypothetical protein|nr:hypothetical protein [Treponema sp.]